MTTKYVDPISRIEGHLGVNLTTSGGFVTEANVHGNLWRGFENFLIGRVPNDAITFVQRICGVCPVPHGMTSTFAVESALGYNSNFQTFSTATAANGVTPKALHIRNLILGSEFLMSSLTHFYHLAAPSYVQGPAIPPWTPYFAEPYYAAQLRSMGHGITAAGAVAGPTDQGALPALGSNGFSKDLWSAVINQYVKALRIRRLTFEAGALFSGRMPMTSAFIAGGVGFNNTTNITSRIAQFQKLTSEIGTFIVQEYVPLVLALGALYPTYDNVHNGGAGYGGGCGNFLAWGGFPQVDGTLALSNGWKRLGLVANMGAAGSGSITVADVQANLTEDITKARYVQDAATGYTAAAVYPGNVSRTIPDRSTAAKYSWLKAPRWAGKPMEVGPMARMFVMGLFQDNQPLATTVAPGGGLVGYAAYAKVVGPDTGLAPAMINPDLAVACVAEGLAKVKYSGGTVGIGVGGDLDIRTLPQSTIAAVYYDPTAVIIDGAAAPLASWVLGIKAGLSTMDRLRARGIESLFLVQKMLGAPSVNATNGVITWPALGGWLGGLDSVKGTATYVVRPTPKTQILAKFGATEAPRGALMHFISINNGKILKYQCVVPTTWNGGPKDAAGVRGPMEQAMIGIPYNAAAYPAGGAQFTKQGGGTQSTDGGVEALRVAQSFDPCIACAVH